MKVAEIKELSHKELKERIENEKTYLLKMKMNHAVSTLDNPMKINETRKNIARLLTELNKRKYAEVKQ
jgi:large subunit ribosomal protein L29